MWLPFEWWIDLKKSEPAWTFRAGVVDLVEIESSAKFRWQKEASREAINALRLMAYDIRDVGWTKFRCHSRIPGTHRAFCGAQVGDSPNLQNYGTEPCGNCYRILETIQNPDEPETDVKKHFRYVSFNSEIIPVGLQQALEKHVQRLENNKHFRCSPM